MYDIRQFRPTFYVVLIIAFAGYGIALQSPPHLIGGILLLALHAALSLRGSAVQIPRRLASVLAVLTGLWSLAGLIRGSADPLLAISQWLFMLVLITLYSRRDNRAYGQMLVMSLVLMVAGAVNTASLLFAVLFIAYLFLALYCCLLFHLKVETEYATRAYSITDNHSAPPSLRHDRQYFNRSMRRLTALVAIVAVAAGVAVFLLFPRSRIGPALAMGATGRQGPPLTGFSERIGFDQVARIARNSTLVAQVALSDNGHPPPPGDLYLRGLTLDIYTGRSPRSNYLNWQWARSAENSDLVEQHHLVPGEQQPLASSPAAGAGAGAGEGARQIRQTILLQPTGTATLFALDGVTAIASDAAMLVQYSPVDGSLRNAEPLRTPIRYEAISTGEPPPVPTRQPGTRPGIPQRMRYPLAQEIALITPPASRIDPLITQYALRPEVSGSDANGPFAAQRPRDAQGPTPLDETIASAISRHLQTQFRYTLDLSDVARPPQDDPIVQFLYDLKRGHCEYFAGAMTLMCQSLGLKARVVIGFRAGTADYNYVGGYYMVKQSNAHAWVEVLTPQGWKSFDPTAADSYEVLRQRSMFAPLADFFDYLQYEWASSVVAYDNQNLSVLTNVETGFSQSMAYGGGWLDAVGKYFRSEKAYEFSTRVLAAAIVASLLILIAAIAFYIAKRARLDRRAQRIGLGALPHHDRLRLARQLRFYDDLLQLLARQRITRPPHLTPREFASGLSFLAPEIYGKIGHVTEVFYRVRYGKQPLAPRESRRVDSLIAEIASGLGPCYRRETPSSKRQVPAKGRR